MKKQQRLDMVIEALQEGHEHRLVTTRELAERLDVSEMTIRRDLTELAEAGLIQRVHGGATLHQRQPSVAGQRGQIGILRTTGKDKYLDPFYSEVLEAADRKLQALGYRAAYIFSYVDVHSQQQAHDLLANYQADAILLIGAYPSESVEYLRRNVRVVVSVTSSLGPEHDAILMDGYNGIRAQVDHLVALGQRRLGFITGYHDHREQGFWDGVRAHGLSIDPTCSVRVAEGGFKTWTPELGQSGAAQLMQQDKPPTAIVCASDRLAIGAMQWLHQSGYRVPDDIAVTGFDNIRESAYTIPPLTTVHVHKDLIGELAVERAVRRIEDPTEVPLQITTPTSLVVRQSCGAAVPATPLRQARYRSEPSD